jgi:spore coat polysaccharide biosynthesis protein SpsF
MKAYKLAIIQARMSSSRLPGKVLKEIGGKPMLLRMLERVKKAKLIDGVVVATTIDPSDDILAQFCQKHDLPCYRGSLADVLDRYVLAVAQYEADVVIRLTADCPLIDPQVIDLTISVFLGESDQLLTDCGSQIRLPDTFPFHFAANRLPPPWKRTLPIGLDVEVCSAEALRRAWVEADQLYQREHVMPYIYEGVAFQETAKKPDTTWYVEQSSTPRGFRVALLNHTPDYGNLRWTVDTPADLEFVRQVYSRLQGRPDFSWLDILELVKADPSLATINANAKHKSAFDVDQRITGT